MKKKLFILILAIAACLACVFVITACKTDDGSGTQNKGNFTHVHSLSHFNAVEATCSSNGHIEYWYCIGCRNYYSDETASTQVTDNIALPALGHVYGKWIETEPATCTTAGVETRYCSHDNTHTETREIAKLDHTVSDWIIDSKAACEKVGNKHKECTVCHTVIETAEIPALGHGTSSDWIIDSKAACEKVGNKHKECTVCHTAIETAEISALGHGTSSDWIIDLEAACETTGNKHKECTVCHTVIETAEIRALEHSYGSYTPNNDATCTTDGTETRICSHCGKNDTKAVENSAFGHSLGDVVEVVGSTCSEQGYTIYSCSVCGENFNEDFQPVLEHNFDSEWICTLCGYEYETEGLLYGLYYDGYYYYVAGYNGDSSEVVIPAHHNGRIVKKISSNAFENCSGVTSVTIPYSVTSIDSGTFSSCSSLTSINVNNGNNIYHSDGNCLIETQSNTLISGCMNSVIPNDGSVTSIGKNAFLNCSGLTSIIIPDSVTSIGSSAFSGCSSLESITIPFVGSDINPLVNAPRQFGHIFGTSSYTGGTETNSDGNRYYIPSTLKNVTVTGGNIHSTAFYNCSGLTSITIGNSVTSIGQWAFVMCSGLTSITIGNSVTSIGQAAFGYCSGLTSITIPDGVTSIGDSAFNNCSGLTSITVPDSVTSIGWGVFSGCSSLESITIPFVGGNIKTASSTNQYPFGYIFGTNSYNGGTLTKQMYYGSSTTSLTSTYYYIPTTLKSVTVTGGNILYGAFYNCSRLTSITIPDSVKSIGVNAFYNCSGLTSITIPDSVKSIGSDAFSGCSSLESITIPFVGGNIKTASSTNQYPFGYIFGTNIYNGGTATKQVYYGSSATDITNTTYYIPTTLKSVTVTGGNILYGAFYNCSGLTSITIGDSVTSIGQYAFYNCSELTSIIIGDSVTSIGEDAFFKCSGLKSIVIGESVTSIGSYAFSHCSSLVSITIPNSVTRIDSWALNYCGALIEINYVGTKEQWDNISKGQVWVFNVGSYTIHCTDGDIEV